MAQQLGPLVEAATVRAKSAWPVIQGLCEVNPEATVMSIDGISAFDQISKAAMLDGLFSRCGRKAIPSVRLFHISPSVYI